MVVGETGEADFARRSLPVLVRPSRLRLRLLIHRAEIGENRLIGRSHSLLVLYTSIIYLPILVRQFRAAWHWRWRHFRHSDWDGH